MILKKNINNENKDNNIIYVQFKKNNEDIKSTFNKIDNHQINEFDKNNMKETNESKVYNMNDIVKVNNNKNESNIQYLKKIGDQRYKEYSTDELKQRKNEIEILFKDLCKNIIGNKNLSDLNIKEINSEEILKNKDSQELRQIILMDEESSKKFQTFINYQKLNEFIKSDDKIKDNLIENYHEEFNKIFNILSGNIELPNEIKLIDEYIKCKKNIDINSQFQLFKNNFKIEKNFCTYYFTYKNDSFIFFPKENKILKLKLDNDFEKYNRFYLEEYIENNKDIEMSYVKIIYSACQNNINIKKERNQIKDYYLINKRWLDSKLQEYSKIANINEIKILKDYIYETIKPELIFSKYNNFSYPVDFYFIEKEKFLPEILKLSRIFKIEDFSEYKIIFVCDNNMQKEKKSIYIGLILNKDIKDNKLFVIYFYSIKYDRFEIEFIIKYYNEEMMFKEIKDNIMPKGIEVYLNIMNNNHDNNNLEEKLLYDLDLNNIGFYIN